VVSSRPTAGAVYQKSKSVIGHTWDTSLVLLLLVVYLMLSSFATKAWQLVTPNEYGAKWSLDFIHSVGAAGVSVIKEFVNFLTQISHGDIGGLWNSVSNTFNNINPIVGIILGIMAAFVTVITGIMAAITAIVDALTFNWL
jgi:hypothetical protein